MISTRQPINVFLVAEDTQQGICSLLDLYKVFKLNKTESCLNIRPVVW